MMECARLQCRARAMTTILLTSAKKPLLDFVRQRLLPSEARKGCALLIPLTEESAGEIAAALGESAKNVDLASMPGFHEIASGTVRVIIIRAKNTVSALREVTGVPDFVVSMPEDVGNSLRRLMGPCTVLVMPRQPDRVPGFLEADGKAWRLRVVRRERTAVSAAGSVLIVGAGLAGAMVARELSLRGLRPIVVDAGPVPGSGASALYAGLIHPHWQASDSPLFQLTRAGFEAMTQTLTEFPEIFIPTGVVDAASSDEEYDRWHSAAAAGCPVHLPEEFASLLTREEASKRTGLKLSRGGWFYPKAGLVHAGRFVRRLLEASGAEVLSNMCVHLQKREGLWEAVSMSGSVVARAPCTVVCAALSTPDVLGMPRGMMGLGPLYGRISLLRETDISSLRCALTGDGYVAKTKDFCAVGATYEPGEAPGMSAEAAHEHNLRTFDKLMGGRPEVLAAGFYEGVRAVPLDRMPLAGRGWLPEDIDGLAFKGVPEAESIPRAPGLWVCAGFGSRGLTWGLACARHVAAEMTGDVQALPRSLALKLDPARFLPKLLVS